MFPVRVRVRAEMNFLDLVKGIDQTVLSLQTRQLHSFSDIQEMYVTSPSLLLSSHLRLSSSGIQYDLTEMSTVATYDESAAPELNLAPYVSTKTTLASCE